MSIIVGDCSNPVERVCSATQKRTVGSGWRSPSSTSDPLPRAAPLASR